MMGFPGYQIENNAIDEIYIKDAPLRQREPIEFIKDKYMQSDTEIELAEDPRKRYAVRRLSEQEEKLREYTKRLIDKVEKEHEAESVAKKHEVRKYQY